MRLLIATQVVDENDPVLGFFCGWIAALAPRFESLEVICLKEGKHELPSNVRVHSLGKEQGARSRGAYALRFLSLAWRLRNDYDAVFVHMNQEYILLAGWLWKMLGKPVYLWRNHYAGSRATDRAVAFCKKVFYTSKHSYTAKFKNAVQMPVGVDTSRFHEDASIKRTPRSILFLSRMAPSKRPELLVEALHILKSRNIDFSATFCGSPLPADGKFYRDLKDKAGDLATFIPAVANQETPQFYASHAVFVNCSPSGMLDKTLFEAAASGCFVLAASEDFAALAGAEHHFISATELADRLESALRAPAVSPAPFVAANDLDTLAARLAEAI